MTDAITRLMEANLIEVFNQHDTELRRTAITRTYAPTCAGPTTTA